MKILEQAKLLALTGSCTDLIQNIQPEDISRCTGDELMLLHEILIGPHVSLALAALQKGGFFKTLIPQIEDGLNLISSKYFKEIWPHTLRVVSQTPPKLNLRWAALFHDLGKAQAFSVQSGKVTFHHHEKISAKIFDRFAKRARIFTPGQKSHIYFLIANLGYVEGYVTDWTDSAVRRFAKEMGVYVDDLLSLSESDITTGHVNKRNKILHRIQELRVRIIRIREEDAKQGVLPKGLGNEIMVQLQIPVGPRIGEIRKYLEAKIDAGELNANENIQYYIEFLKKEKIENTTNTDI